MNTKLTLRLDETLIRRAKAMARLRGKSVSQMVKEYFDSLGEATSLEEEIPPVTASLFGILKGHEVHESDYQRHLLEKHIEGNR
jgi:hypothetical protein